MATTAYELARVGQGMGTILGRCIVWGGGSGRLWIRGQSFKLTGCTPAMTPPDRSLWSFRPMPRILGHEEGLPCLISRVRFPLSRAFVT